MPKNICIVHTLPSRIRVFDLEMGVSILEMGESVLEMGESILQMDVSILEIDNIFFISSN